MNLLAAEFPASSFHGYDIAEDGIERAREESAALALSNTKFEVVNVANLPGEPEFDLITAFDAVHDQRHPADVLRGIHQSMTPDGIFLMVEFKFSSNLEDNIDNPFAPLYYSVSLMHCMPVSLAVGGDGSGTVWGSRRRGSTSPAPDSGPRAFWRLRARRTTCLSATVIALYTRSADGRAYVANLPSLGRLSASGRVDTA